MKVPLGSTYNCPLWGSCPTNNYVPGAKSASANLLDANCSSAFLEDAEKDFEPIMIIYTSRIAREKTFLDDADQDFEPVMIIYT